MRSVPPPSAILLDVFMPEMNGWRFAEQLRGQASLAHVPLALSSHPAVSWRCGETQP